MNTNNTLEIHREAQDSMHHKSDLTDCRCKTIQHRGKGEDKLLKRTANIMNLKGLEFMASRQTTRIEQSTGAILGAQPTIVAPKSSEPGYGDNSIVQTGLAPQPTL